MPLSPKQLELLHQMLPVLREDQVLDGESAERLERYCAAGLRAGEPAAARDRVGRKLSLFLTILSALLASGGLILIIAHNWNWLPPAGKLALAYGPLAAALALGGFTLYARKGAAWCESSALLIAAAFAGALAIISQNYHILGTLTEFLIVVLLLTAPLLYLFNPMAFAVLYAVGVVILDCRPQALTPTLLLALAAMPFLIQKIRRAPESGAAQLARLLLLFLGWAVLIRCMTDCSFTANTFLFTTATLATYFAGLANRKYAKFNLYLAFGYIGLAGFVLTAGFPDFQAAGRWKINFNTRVETITVLIGAAGYLWLVLEAFLRRRMLHRTVPALLPGLTLLLPLLPINPAWGYNLYGVTGGVLLLTTGIKRRSFGLLNLGMALLALLIFLRFCSASGNSLSYGVAFITLSLIVGAVNIYAIQSFRRQQDGEAQP